MTGITERVGRLREHYMTTVPRVDTDRAVLITKSYQETEHEPGVLRRAKAFKRIMDEMVIIIADDELLVGNQGRTYRGASLYPELGFEWLYEELDNGVFESRTASTERFLISEEDKRALREIRGYWRDRTVSSHMLKAVPEGTQEITEGGVLTFRWPELAPSSVGHFNPDFAKLLRKGLLGIKKDAEEQIEKLGVRIDGKGMEKYHFWKAIIIVCDAAANFGRRYAALAREMAANEKDSARKADLLQIADVCDRVPAHPADTFREACQSFWFLQLLMHIDANHPGVSPGRFDQYMYPYYKRDIEEGHMARVEAQELLECLWIKFSEINRVKSVMGSIASGGYSSGQNIIVGGQTRDGRDATNELSYMLLDVQANLSFHEPSLAIRIWDGTPDDLWHKAVETTKIVGGLPSFQNDEIIIPQLLHNGVGLEDARDYCIIGCVEPSSSGNAYPCCGGTGASNFFNMPQALVLALNNGVNPNNGKQAGLATGDLSTFKTFDEVKEAYVKQVHHHVDWMVTLTNTWDLVNPQVMPLPLLSAVMEPCVERGIDITAGGAKYNFTGTAGVGTSNVADALAAIKKLVFEDKKYAGAELLEAMRTNWEGREVMRNDILNGAPKFGNDDPYVDDLARWSTSVYSERCNQAKSPRGSYVAGLWPVAVHVILGKMTGATLDGRKAGEALAEGISPRQGMDRKGPTAALKSAASLDQFANLNGTLLNMKFHPNAVKGWEGTEKVRNLIQTYFDMKGMHIQLNVVSAEMLREAQKNPDQYKNLVVRVAGYSAFFVELYKDLQDDIISRTEHAA